jgi:hypothetical protein
MVTAVRTTTGKAMAAAALDADPGDWWRDMASSYGAKLADWEPLPATDRLPLKGADWHAGEEAPCAYGESATMPDAPAIGYAAESAESPQQVR